MTKPKTDFSFADHAPIFDAHIKASIPNYSRLVEDSVTLSLNHVQTGTCVVDLGCSRGTFLTQVRKANQLARPKVQYLGIDREPLFSRFWRNARATNIRCEVGDVTAYQLNSVSFASSLFTVQFLQPKQKLPLLKRLNESLVEGGALIIAEKTLATTPQLQQELDGLYYDYKRKMGFTAEQILDKQRALRGQMTLWTESELRDNLLRAGFRQFQEFWRGMMFVGILALK
jgi:tRNA (cmo5U34)-methyltransferase